METEEDRSDEGEAKIIRGDGIIKQTRGDMGLILEMANMNGWDVNRTASAVLSAYMNLCITSRVKREDFKVIIERMQEQLEKARGDERW